VNLTLLANFAKQDLVDRYAGSLLGAGWTLIWPLVNILIFTLIFSGLMSARLPGVSSPYSYSIYLISGLIAWLAFANTVIRSTSVFADKSAIITKIRIQLPHLPLYIVLSESMTYVISLVLFIGFLLLTGTPLAKTIILVPFVFLLQQIFAYALGFFFAIFNVFSKDAKEFVGVLFQVWFWLTPIVYVDVILPETVQKLLVYNPAYAFIKAYHDIFVFGVLPDTQRLIYLALFTHVLLMLVYVFFKKLEKDIRDFI